MSQTTPPRQELVGPAGTQDTDDFTVNFTRCAACKQVHAGLTAYARDRTYEEKMELDYIPPDEEGFTHYTVCPANGKRVWVKRVDDVA